MAWVAVDSLNRELIFKNEPIRDMDTDYMVTYHGWFDKIGNSWGIELPKGTIKKLIGRDLTWSDEPVELKEENSDGKLFCNDCLTNCIHRKTGTCNYLIKKNSK